jgi:hypothetical protein
MLPNTTALRLDVEQVVAGNVKLNQCVSLLTRLAEAKAYWLQCLRRQSLDGLCEPAGLGTATRLGLLDSVKEELQMTLMRTRLATATALGALMLITAAPASARTVCRPDGYCFNTSGAPVYDQPAYHRYAYDGYPYPYRHRRHWHYNEGYER